MENIIGESFDGASNMRGEFGGVQKLIRDVSPNSVYTWCYAHVLNLAATDIGLQTNGFWSRIMIDEAVGSAKLKKLQKIGDTKKTEGKRNIFGMPKVLNDSVNLPEFNAKAFFEA